MNVDAAVLWICKKVRRKKFSVCNNNHKLRVDFFKNFNSCAVFKRFRLEHGKVVLQSLNFDIGHFQLLLSADGLVRLAEYADYLML